MRWQHDPNVTPLSDLVNWIELKMGFPYISTAHRSIFTYSTHMSSNRSYLRPDGNNKPEKNVRGERMFFFDSVWKTLTPIAQFDFSFWIWLNHEIWLSSIQALKTNQLTFGKLRGPRIFWCACRQSERNLTRFFFIALLYIKSTHLFSVNCMFYSVRVSYFFSLYDTNMGFLPFCTETGQDSTASV